MSGICSDKAILQNRRKSVRYTTHYIINIIIEHTVSVTCSHTKYTKTCSAYIHLLYHLKVVNCMRDFVTKLRTRIIVRLSSRHVLQADSAPAPSLAVGCNICCWWAKLNLNNLYILILSSQEADCIFIILQLVCSKVDHHAMMLSLVQLVVHGSCHLLEWVTV